MVDKNGASFLYRKRGVYYFSKQVPCDIKAYYSRPLDVHRWSCYTETNKYALFWSTIWSTLLD